MKSTTSKIILIVLTLAFIALGAYGVSVWKGALVETAESSAVNEAPGFANESAEVARAKANLGRTALANCHR